MYGSKDGKQNNKKQAVSQLRILKLLCQRQSLAANV